MIEKMKFLSITGPKEDIDRVVDKYLSKYPMHLENALSELSTVRNLYPYMEVNPYKDWLVKAKEYTSLLDPEVPVPEVRKVGAEEAIDIIRETQGLIRQKTRRQDKLREKLTEKKELMTQLAPFRVLPVDVSEIFKFRFIRCRFGRVSKEYYHKLEEYVYDNQDVIFCKTVAEDDYVWGIYFAPGGRLEAVDAVMSSLHFERTRLPDSYEGTAAEAYRNLQKECRRLNKKIDSLQNEIREELADKAGFLWQARKKLESMTFNFDVRKLAACTKEQQNTFYILCGWMTEKDAAHFQKAIADDSKIYCIVEEPADNPQVTPPTKLKNRRLFRPFEMYVKMYGLPSYNEVDPTAFVALTYAFIFGAMFGDLGQGLLLCLGGFALYKYKHIPLAAIIGTAGIFSAFFGLMFGSIFGFENIIDAVWLRPKEAMTNLPLIGNLNTVFVVAIAFGMFLIMVTMIFHIVNAVKAHREGDKWFDTNGAAGLVFYAMLTIMLFLYMTGHKLPPTGIVLACILLPLLVVAMKEPLSNLVEKRKPLIEDGIGMFLVQTFFEMFETLLSFFSNTLSFVRVGAFAVSHAAMMEVVLMLAGAENGGHINWLVVILGNLFVCGLEGLIVGIQVLRLEYYEMFSRFYRGDGREFRPFGQPKENN